MDFVRSYFNTNEPLTCWTLLSSFFDQISAGLEKSEDKSVQLVRGSLVLNQLLTAEWIWDRSIYSIIKPSIKKTLFQYFWRFAEICKEVCSICSQNWFFFIVSVIQLLIISADLLRFARNLQHLLTKLFLLLFLNNFTTETITKTILWANAANFLQICANLHKYWNIFMSNDSSSIELIDQSHGD